MGRPPKYPWNKWFARKRYRLVFGKHFSCLPHAMAQQIRTEAGRRSTKVHIHVTQDAVEVRNQVNA